MNKLGDQIFKSKVFCILPWIHFHALPNKKVLPCCMANSDLPVSNTEHESVIKMMNTDEYKQLRLNMLNDVPSDVCKRCYDVELLGTWSLRLSQNRVRGLRNVDLVRDTNEDGSVDDFRLKYMDIRWSNICNFKCRSCGPEFSSLHAKEYIEKKHDKIQLKKYFNMDDIVVSCNEDNQFFDKLKPYLNDVDEVYFAGGESLITPEHYQLLDFWLENDRDDIELSYTTNFSVFKYKDKSVLDYWQKFRKVKIYASLDADGRVGELLRSGTKWKDIENNVRMIREKAPHVEFNLTPTISIWNVHRFADFFTDWIDKELITKNMDLRLNLLTHPWYANIQHLPDFYKDEIYEKFKIIREDEQYSREIRNAFAMVMYTLNSGKPDPWAIMEFFNDNLSTDKMRNENIFFSIPELKPVYQWARKQTGAE